MYLLYNINQHAEMVHCLEILSLSKTWRASIFNPDAWLVGNTPCRRGDVSTDPCAQDVDTTVAHTVTRRFHYVLVPYLHIRMLEDCKGAGLGLHRQAMGYPSLNLDQA